MTRISGWVVALVLPLANAVPAAAALDGFAAMGASETAGLDYTGSWVPYAAFQRGLNFGGASLPYDVAVGGATSVTLLQQHQHTDVASLVQQGLVDVSYMMIGGNDFSAVGGQIANGSLSGASLTVWAQGVVNNIDTALDTVLAAHPAGMIVAGMPDIPLTPAGRASFSTSVTHARGENAVDVTNSLLEPAVLARHLVYVDIAGALRYLNQQPLVVGGVAIDLVTPDTDPTHFFQDGKHPAAVGNGLFANLFLEALNKGYGTHCPLLTDQEILNIAGLGASYTGETTSIPYDSFIISGVPEPSTWGLAASAAAIAGLWRARQRIRKPHRSRRLDLRHTTK